MPRLPRLAASAALALLALLPPALLVRREAAYRDDTAAARALLPSSLAEETLREIGREPDPIRRRNLIARALFAHEADPRWMLELSPDEAVAEAKRSRQRLAAIEQLSRQVSEVQPTSYQASLFLGGATLLALLRDAPAAVWSGREQWETPLRRARQLAPGSPEPVRLLAAGTLSVWDRLPEVRRSEGRELLREAFADPDTFARLVDLWLQVAGTPEDALSVVPDETFVWTRLLGQRAAANDPERWMALSARYESARRRQLADLLEEARSRARLGDTARAAAVYRQIATSVPVDRTFLPIAAAAFSERPPGPAGAALAAVAEEWLAWSEEAVLYGREGLPDAALRRLAGSLGAAPPVTQAKAHLLAGDLATAQRIERRADAHWSEEWAPYLLLLSHAFLARGDEAAAEAALRQVHRNERRALPYWLARQHLALTGVPGGDPEEVTEALAGWRGTTFEATDWRFHRRQPYLELIAPAGGGAIHLEMLEASPAELVVEAVWDGERLPPRIVRDGRVEWTLPVAPGPHRLGLRFPLGGRAVPGTLRIEATAGADRATGSDDA